MRANRMTPQKTILSKRRRGPGGRERLERLASALGCCVATVRRAEAQGAPVESREGMSAWFAARKNVPRGAAKALGGVLAEIEALKLRKVELQIEWLKIQIAKDRGELIPAERVIPGVIRLAREMRNDFEEFVRNIPGWTGLPREEIGRRLAKKCAELADRLDRGFAELLGE